MLNLSTLKTPGVYIDEVPLLPPSVAAVETGIPAFVGYTEYIRTGAGQDLLRKPVRITSLLEYIQLFGGAQAENNGIAVTIVDTVEKYLADEEKEKLVSRDIAAVLDPVERSKFNQYYALQWYFANGGGPCYIVSVGQFPADGTGQPLKNDLLEGVKVLETEDEPTMIVVPEAIFLDRGENAGIFEEALKQSAKLGDRMVIIDALQSGTDKSVVATDIRNFRTKFDENRMFATAYYPYINTTIDFKYNDAAVTIGHVRKDQEAGTEDKKGKWDGKTIADLSTDKVLQVQIRAQIDQMPMVLPPSPAIAAVWANTDSARGVWKAPANVGLANVIGPTIKIDEEMQRDMNVDINAGKSVNAIRQLTGRGTVVWGARTLMGESNEWRYINVRRFFNFVEESVKKSTYRFVFEPNDANTWISIRAMIENFLTLQWRAGALQGSKPEQAFFVRVGLGQTMTALDILEGRLIVEIGMAVVRPAEFIILRFMHKLPEA